MHKVFDYGCKLSKIWNFKDENIYTTTFKYRIPKGCKKIDIKNYDYPEVTKLVF